MYVCLDILLLLLLLLLQMKSTIHISVNQELTEHLRKETNYSELINDLIYAHYEGKNCENINILKQKCTETKQIIKINRKKLRDINKKITKVLEKEKKILKIKEKNLKKEIQQGQVTYIKRAGRTIVKYN